MSNKPQKSGLFIYIPVALLAGFFVFRFFVSNFEKGEAVGKVTPQPVGGKKTSGVPAVDLRALAQNNDLVSKGKTLFMINCASCHGASGTGDGDRAASLNPKPRNFKAEKFKFGNDIYSIYETLQKGSPGTSMPSFALLPPEDDIMMAHYVYSLIPNPTPNTPEIINKFPETKGGEIAAPTVQKSSAELALAAMKADTTKRIPIQLAMQILEEPASKSKRAAAEPAGTDRAKNIYLNRCAACHGKLGEGKATKLVNYAPYGYQYTESLTNPNAWWVNDKEKFFNMVTQGLPGRAMPGSATLNKNELEELYNYVRGFAQAQ